MMRLCAPGNANFSNSTVWSTDDNGKSEKRVREQETCRWIVDEMNALVNDVARTVAENAENIGHCRLHRQSTHAQTVSSCAACDQLLRNYYSCRHWRRKLRQQWRHLHWRHILPVCRRCSRVQTSIENLQVVCVTHITPRIRCQTGGLS